MADANLSGLTPETSDALNRLIAGAKARGITLNVNSAFRSLDDQRQLYANFQAGRAGKPLPYPDRGAVALAARPGYSPHEFGVAFDVSPTDRSRLGEVNDIGRSLGLTTVAGDPGHFQLANWHGGAVAPDVPASQSNSLIASHDAPAPIGTTVNTTPSFTLPANAPMGMQNNNPLNIKYYAGAPYAGLVGPSKNTDQGDPQMVFSSPEAGWSAGYSLLNRKYQGGMTTPAAIIAGKGGWTPGNMQAAANIAKTAGIGVNDDIGFNDPGKAAKFMRALVTQEQGGAGSAYSDAMIANAVKGAPAAQPSGPIDPSIIARGGTSPAIPGSSTPGTTLTSSPIAGAKLPGFPDAATSNQFVGGLDTLDKAMGGPGVGQTTAGGGDRSQPPPAITGGGAPRNVSPLLPMSQEISSGISGYRPGVYGQTLTGMQPLQWGANPVGKSMIGGAGQQGAPTYGSTLNSMQAAYGLSPQQIAMLMDPMMLNQQMGGGGYG